MKHGTYVGNEYPFLKKGMGALLRDHPTDPTKVLAQFDVRSARRNDVSQGFGWHEYSRSDFEFDVQEPQQ